MAADDIKNTEPHFDSPIKAPQASIQLVTPLGIGSTFPPKEHATRMGEYEFYQRLFDGDHYNAFNVKIDNETYGKVWARLKYVACNFAGLISKTIADMLFSEPVGVKVPDGDQDFVDALWRENNMDVQCYESALTNSALGDTLFKIRVGKRNPKDKNSTVIIEEIYPSLYLPELDPFNVRADTVKDILAWRFKSGDKEYLRSEIHTPGMVENKLYMMNGEKIDKELDLTLLGPVAGLVPAQPTGIDHSLIVHVPNWRQGNRHFGISDYKDLDSIFFAINNRLTKTDNILDKHSDPILTVPPGILDEKGQVNKKALGVIEVGEGESGRPEYIVWDASLDNAFKEIDQLVQVMEMVGEVSPDLFGMGNGQSDSGRALKFKLMRTIAKAARKKLYYNLALKKVVYIAQLMAKAHGLEVGGVKLTKNAAIPELEWADGLPTDDVEQTDLEIKKVDAGLKSKKAAIMRLEQVDEKAAEQMLKDTKEESAITMPKLDPNADMLNHGNANGTHDHNMPQPPKMTN